MVLCDDAMKILTSPNAGGSSILSEALSMHILHDQLQATSVKTEMEIQYWCVNWKKCDYITQINGNNAIVSVTRVAYGFGKSFTEDMAYHLCAKKLSDLAISRLGIYGYDGFGRSILHILCRSEEESRILSTIYDKLPDEIRSDITVIISIITGQTDRVFSNKRYT